MYHLNMSLPGEPISGVGVFVVHRERVLLVRRRNSPGAGEWALPGGRIEPGETLQRAGERETLEETGIVIRAGDPLFAFDLIERDETDALLRHLVIIDLAAEYVSGVPVAGDDAREARWVGREEIEMLPVHFMTLKFLSEIVKFVR